MIALPRRLPSCRQLFAAALIFAASHAFAAGPSGGLAKAQSAFEDIKTGLFALVGVLALIYLIYMGIMAFTEKKSWSDFGWGVVHVAVVGGSVALGSWAWALFA